MSMTFVPYSKVAFGGFWKHRQDVNAHTTLDVIHRRFTDTGRFAGLDFDGKTIPHIYYDSDLAKWYEAVAYVTCVERDARLETIVDQAVEKMIAHQRPDGYFNMHFLQADQDKVFTGRTNHELYCAGHYLEAAIAYLQATGKRPFYDMMLRYVDYIEKVFVKERSAGFVTPGHEEIELALMKLHAFSGEKRYLNLARFFIDNRGVGDEAEYAHAAHGYSQSHLPVRQQRTAEGHAVRAGYLYAAMADLALADDDGALKKACQAIYRNITDRRMYITGGIGSTERGEAFTIDYDLPNLTAYSESCAAIALMLFSQRMLRLDADSLYADTLERALYNGFLSAVSLDGTSFFYVNPLEIAPRLKHRDTSAAEAYKRKLPMTQRREVFDCSCCPPNIARFIASLGQYVYSHDESGTLYIHQYAQNQAEIGGARVVQQTDYPANGSVKILVTDSDFSTIALRKPSWCRHWTVKLNGLTAPCEVVSGYIRISGERNMVIELDFAMSVTLLEANPLVYENCGRVAVQYGPVVYCAEAIDNGENVRDIALDRQQRPLVEYDPDLYCNVLYVDGRRSVPCDALYRPWDTPSEPVRVKLIPYFAFANRGESEMVVWFLKGA